MSESIIWVRPANPPLRYTHSFAGEYDNWRDPDVRAWDLLEPHLWVASDDFTDFYERIGWSSGQFDSNNLEELAARGPETYLNSMQRYDQALFDAIDNIVAWSRSTSKPLITTKCWSAGDYKDWPGLDWDWALDFNRRAGEHVVTTGRWVGTATSNFCGLQLVGVGRDIEYHKRMTAAIKSARIDPDVGTAFSLGSPT